MKKLIFLALLSIGLSATSFAQQAESPSAQTGVQYGKKINKSGAIAVNQLNSKLNTKSSYTGKIEGKVVQVCKKKGCFMTLQTAEGQEPILVRFKDYGFFMPQDIVGKTVVVEGVAKQKETSVETLRHNAADLRQSKEEIAQITTPKKEISIIADGVVVVK